MERPLLHLQRRVRSSWTHSSAVSLSQVGSPISSAYFIKQCLVLLAVHECLLPCARRDAGLLVVLAWAQFSSLQGPAAS